MWFKRSNESVSSQSKELGTQSATEFTEHSDVQVDDKKWPSIQDPTYFSAPWKEYLFIFASMMSQLLNQAGTTQTLSLINVLSKNFDSSTSQQTWLMASFPLVSGSFILVSGKIGDIYGLKKTLLIGYVVTIIWSLICGLTSYTSSVEFFIISRAFQGLGIAFILPNIMGIVGNIYVAGTTRKNMVISLIGACAPIGATMGVLFSGLIGTLSERWAWTFYAYTITAAINMGLSIWVIPNTIPTNVRGSSMDWIGSGIGLLGMILFNFVWNQGPIVGWDTAYIIVLLIVSVAAIVAFFLYETKYANDPLIPRPAMHNHRLLMTLLAVFFGWGSFGIWTFYYFCFVLNLREYTPLWAGGSYFMFLIWGIIAAISVGYTIKRIPPSLILFLSMLAFDCGCIMLSVTPVDQTYFRMILGMMIILSFGMDLSFPASSIILSDELPMENQGMAGSLVSTMINYSMSMCLGIAGTVEHQINKNGDDLLKGYRAALYLGIGLASLGVFISALFMLENYLRMRRRNAKEKV